jgi:GDP-L-fucose synthase
MESDAKIFIAGHNGLVGSAILKNLTDGGYKNLITKTRSELDLADQLAVTKFFESEKPEYVFLAAAKVGGILANNTFPGDFIYENLQIQTNVIHASYVSGVKRLLFLGSSCIYPKDAPQPLLEKYLLTGALEDTNRPYALAKITGIEMCWSYNRQFQTRFLSVMPTNLFGPNDNFDLNNSHVLPALIRKFHLAKLARNGDSKGIEKDELIFGEIPEPMRSEIYQSAISKDGYSVKVWGTGKPKREFMHSEDMAEACVFLMSLNDASFDSLLASDRNGGLAPIINIGVGEDISIKDLAKSIQEITEYRGDVIFDIDKPDGTPRKLLNIDRLKMLGWDKKVSFKTRLMQTYSSYLKKIQ